ncbi:homoserine O-succinyltransferase [Candidatus Methanarcanum hacksteinii]|uniref:homoserine O-succinyltransferase n=1 Tax=Candidatus Methanarcanum hacksteinii TaxID=2911857 RepID=UPI0037DD3778
MPIKIPEGLPAFLTLENENIFVMDDDRARTQDIRPLKIAILNLMPTKVETEIQLLRLLSNTPLQVDVDLIIPSTHESKHTSINYLTRFYKRFSDIEDRYYDGMIITGAPLEDIPFEKVDYWDEMCRIMDWTKEHVWSTMYICWASMAGLYHHYGIQKRSLLKKRSGIFEYRNVIETEPLMRGIDQYLKIPQSRHATISSSDIKANPRLNILAETADDDTGIVISDDGQIFITGHLEYDRSTLADEYSRDMERGLNTEMPKNYFPNDDDRYDPIVTWRSHSTLIFTNWLNYYVYQQTPYDIRDISKRLTKR